ncbi:MAG: PAS domain S-box protein [Nitrospinota bacterium]|nr:PAS domain S-box protein [Nitrospinota bacterium]
MIHNFLGEENIVEASAKSGKKRRVKGIDMSFGQKITTQYVLALGLIAILVLASYLALLELMTAQATWAQVINLSGRQRMLSQRISKLAHDLVMGTHEDSASIRQDLKLLAYQMEKAHEAIVRNDLGSGYKIQLSKAAEEIIFYPPHELDKMILRYADAVRKFADAPPRDLSQNNSYFLIIEEYSERPLLDSLDTLVVQFQAEAEENSSALKQRATLISTLLLLTLLVVGVVIFRPLANRIQRSAAELAESERRLSAITTSLGEGVIVTDREGVITFANPMAEHITGFKEEDLVGMNVMDLKLFSLEGVLLAKDERVLVQALHSSPMGSLAQAVEQVSVRTREMIVERKMGDRQIVEMNVSRLMDKGHVAGVVASIRDITMRKTMESILAAKSELVQLLQEIAFAVNEVDTVDEAMSVCLNKVCRHTAWEIGHVYKPDEEDTLHPTELWYTKSTDKFEEFRTVTKETKFKPGAGLPGRVYASKKPAWIKDVRTDPNFPRAGKGKESIVRAGFAFPLLEGDKVVAVLEFFSTRTMDQDDSIMNMANYLSTQLGRVTERKRDMEMIKQAKENAEAATLLKDKFLSLVAHDMRTPLSTILGLVKSLQTDVPDPITPMQMDIFSKVIASSENMVEMIDNLLDLERLQSGNLKVDRLNLDAKALVEEVIESLSYEASAKNIRMQNDIHRGVKILADYELIIEVIKNIVHNSIKFCSDGDKIIFFRPDDDEVAIAIRDTGPGVRKEVLPDIFRHEVKTSTIGTSGEYGTGLGLPLCHDIMKAHQGEISVETEEGKGAIFYLKLPKQEELQKTTT